MKKWLFIGVPLLALIVVVAVNHRSISAGMEIFVLEMLDAFFPPDYGPEQEMNSGWAAAPPVLDGVLSEGEWDGAAMVEIDATDKSRPGVASGNSNTFERAKNRGIAPYSSNHATICFMNDASYIYVAVDVTDDILDFDADSDEGIWQKDSVEIRVDGNLSCRPSKEGDRFGDSPIVLGDGTRVRGPAPYIQSAAAVKPDGSGYIIEVRWDSTDFEEMIGFDVAINDSDDPDIEQRHCQYYWNSITDNAWQDERQWGIVHLAKETSGIDSSVEPTQETGLEGPEDSSLDHP